MMERWQTVTGIASPRTQGGWVGAVMLCGPEKHTNRLDIRHRARGITDRVVQSLVARRCALVKLS